nr:hypothetical protein [Kibdelosporangium phytohabitans]
MERSLRIHAEEFYRLPDSVVLGDLGAVNDKRKQWEDFYNIYRPHGGLADQTPHEAATEDPTPRPTCQPPTTAAQLVS